MSVPLPKGWPALVAPAICAAIGIAHYILTYSQSWGVHSPLERTRLRAENDRLKSDLAMLREEMRIKDARMDRVAPNQRPLYLPEERFAILELRSAQGWSAAQTARRMLLDPRTIGAWMKELRTGKPSRLLSIGRPVNAYPEMVTHLVQRLRVLLPRAGRKRIADLLARAGLHVSASTVARMGKRDVVSPPPGEGGEAGPERDEVAEDEGGVVNDTVPTEASGAAEDKEGSASAAPRVVTARYPHHAWHCDLTFVSITGMWAPWIPFAMPTVWPFGWHVAVVLDHFTRSVVHVRAFYDNPSAAELCALLDEAAAKAGQAPRHMITDQGSQFQGEYRAWCKEHGVRPRFGAIGQHGSIAVIERFMRTLKEEGMRRIRVPSTLAAMQRELELFAEWYDRHRPHSALGGATPWEKLLDAVPAATERGIETRAAYPLKPKREGDGLPERVPRVPSLEVSYLEGREHLPIIELRRAA